MKIMIRATIAALILIFARSAFPSTLGLYSSISGSMSLSSNDHDEYVLIVTAGGRDNGAATAGSCTILASLTKSNDELKGKLEPLNISDSSYSIEEDREIILKQLNNHINIYHAETLGICAIDANIIESYYKTSKDQQEELYLYFLEIAHEIALQKYKENKTHQAVEILKPYMETNNALLKEYRNASYKAISTLNDYAFFLQEEGLPHKAIPILEEITEKYPKRIVAHLNLADAYWEAGSETLAVRHYHVYIKLMQEAGLYGKIPSRALQRASKLHTH